MFCLAFNKKKEVIDQEIRSLRSPVSSASETRVIVVTIFSHDAAELDLQVSYIITNASWKASYDCRVNSTDNTMQLVYYGSITNSSGEDWGNVHLNLSTAVPSAGGSPPKLPTS